MAGRAVATGGGPPPIVGRGVARAIAGVAGSALEDGDGSVLGESVGEAVAGGVNVGTPPRMPSAGVGWAAAAGEEVDG